MFSTATDPTPQSSCTTASRARAGMLSCGNFGRCRLADGAGDRDGITGAAGDPDSQWGLFKLGRGGGEAGNSPRSIWSNMFGMALMAIGVNRRGKRCCIPALLDQVRAAQMRLASS